MFQSWEHESVNHGSQMRVKRSPATNGNVFIAAPPSHRGGKSPHDDPDSQDFDDLIFALKTGGGFTPSETSHTIDRDDIEDIHNHGPYERRRISIADTHL